MLAIGVALIVTMICTGQRTTATAVVPATGAAPLMRKAIVVRGKPVMPTVTGTRI